VRRMTNDARTLDDEDDDWFDWADAPWLAEVLDPGEWDATGPDDDLPEHDDTPLQTPDELLRFLLGLVGPDRAGPRSIWFALLDAEHRPLPAALPLVHVPERPDPTGAARVLSSLARTIDDAAPGGCVAIALVRGEGGDRGGYETAWAQVLREAADEVDLRVVAIAAIGGSRARVLEW
jgi:hypothetical protein